MLRFVRFARLAFRAPSKAHSLRSVSSRFQTRLRWALKPGWKILPFQQNCNLPKLLVTFRNYSLNFLTVAFSSYAFLRSSVCGRSMTAPTAFPQGLRTTIIASFYVQFSRYNPLSSLKSSLKASLRPSISLPKKGISNAFACYLPGGLQALDVPSKLNNEKQVSFHADHRNMVSLSRHPICFASRLRVTTSGWFMRRASRAA